MAGRTGAAVPIRFDPAAPVAAPWSFSASARKLDPMAQKGENALTTESPEHREAWTYYDEIGEVGQMVSASAGLLSQCRLYVGWVDGDEGENRLRDEDGNPDPQFSPQFVADCEGVLGRYIDQGGSQRGLLLAMAENFDVTGDSYLVGWPVDQDGNPWDSTQLGQVPTEPGMEPSERWEVVSRGALSKQGGQWLLQLGKFSSIKLPRESIVYRMWRKHPRRPDDSRGWVVQALDICRDLRIFTLAQRSAARSGIPSKLLVVASEASPRNLTSPGIPDGGPISDSISAGPLLQPPFGAGAMQPGPGSPPMQQLTWATQLERLIADAVMEALRDAMSGRQVIPAVLSIAQQYIQDFNLLDMSRPIDQVLHELVVQARDRLAESADNPPEMLRGLGETNRWNGAQIADDEFRRYFRPKITAIADAWTVELLWAGLEALGHNEADIRRVRVLVDSRGVVAEPDKAKLAIELFKLGGISRPALRRACQFTETDAATQEDIDLLIALFGRAAAGALAAPAAIGEVPAAVGNPEVNKQAGSAAIEATGAEVVARRPALAKMRTRTAASIPQLPTGAALAQQLALIEQQARARIEEAAEIAFDQALQRGGAKLKAWARRDHDMRGVLAQVDSADVAATLGPARARQIADRQFATGPDPAQRRREDMFAAALIALLASFERIATGAYAQALALLGAEIADEEIAVNVAAGSSVLRQSMLLLADQRVFNPQEPATVGEMRAMSVPTSVTRRAMAAAGGAAVDPGVDPTSDAAMGLVFGPTLAPLEPQVLAWEWDYGSAQRQNPWEGHEDIDGETFSGPDDPALDGVAPDGGPGYPGDHGGCGCDWLPVLVDGSEGDSGDGG